MKFSLFLVCSLIMYWQCFYFSKYVACLVTRSFVDNCRQKNHRNIIVELLKLGILNSQNTVLALRY